jgi:hypothetical protein
MLPSWVYLAAMTIGICAPSVIFAPSPRQEITRQEITLLECLPARIEHPRTLSPEAGEASVRLLIVARHRIANSPDDQAINPRREAARAQAANAVEGKSNNDLA